MKQSSLFETHDEPDVISDEHKSLLFVVMDGACDYAAGWGPLKRDTYIQQQATAFLKDRKIKLHWKQAFELWHKHRAESQEPV